MDMGLIMTVGSAIAGFVMKNMAEARKERHKEHMRAMEKYAAVEESMNNAAARGGVWVRRFLVIAFVSLMGLVTLSGPLLDSPTVYAYLQEGNSYLFGLINTADTIRFELVEGVLFGPELRNAILMIIAFYFGQGAAK